MENLDESILKALEEMGVVLDRVGKFEYSPDEEMTEKEQFVSWLNRNHNSIARPNAVLEWAEDLGPDKGSLFWLVVSSEWSGFDRINHDGFQALFLKFLSSWQPSPEVLALRLQLEVFRGQSGDSPIGLSWTPNRDVALRFAVGHRGIPVPSPCLLKTTVSRDTVAFVCNDREEDEVVLFRPPVLESCSVEPLNQLSDQV